MNLGDTYGGSGSSVMNQMSPGQNDPMNQMATDVSDCDRNAAAGQSNKTPRLPGETDEEHQQRCAGNEENPDPLLLNLDGGGIKLSEPDVVFDILADGTPQTISWTAAGSGDGFLAFDRNNDGQISDRRELFGDATPISRQRRLSFRSRPLLESQHWRVFAQHCGSKIMQCLVSPS